MTRKIVLLAALAGMLLPLGAQAQVTRMKRNPDAIILDSVKVHAGSDMVFVSGQLASPVDPAKPVSEVKSVEEMGDTKAQTISALGKIRTILEAQGLVMADVVKLALFVAPDPRTGKMDFVGANEGFKAFFGTPETPVTVARSTFQVGALVGPYYLIEVEAIAARKAAG